METRMDRYNTKREEISSRTKKNQTLYEDVRHSSLTNFDINSNVSVIEENANRIDVSKVKKMLDERYNDAPKRRSIEVPEFDEPIIEEPIQDTKEYDINAILAKAKKGKNVDYNKERLKKIREAQYEILNNLDLGIKPVDEASKQERKAQEKELVSLINTITELETNYKQTMKVPVSKEEPVKEEENKPEIIKSLEPLEQEEAPVTPVKEETKPQVIVHKAEEKKEEKKEEPPKEEEKEEKTNLEKTMKKLNIDTNYEDFSDISKQDTGAIFLKVIIFAVVIALVVGAIYILNNVLGLGLF